MTFASLQKCVKLAETRKSTDHQSRISPDVLSRRYRPKVDGLRQDAGLQKIKGTFYSGIEAQSIASSLNIQMTNESDL